MTGNLYDHEANERLWKTFRERDRRRRPEVAAAIYGVHQRVIKRGQSMAKVFAVSFGPVNDPNVARRVFTFTAAEAAPVDVECTDPAGGVVNSPALSGTYLDKQTFVATVTAYNAAGLSQEVPTPCSVTINVPAVAPVVIKPAAADAITAVTLVDA